jgi:YHS domain-containing protein
MDGLLTFLIFAALFYFMMRVGCGAHMVHGGDAGGGHGAGRSDADKHIDPVCGEAVPSSEGYGKMHSDHLYRFCSRQCLDAFDAEPERYMGHQTEAAQ